MEAYTTNMQIKHLPVTNHEDIYLKTTVGGHIILSFIKNESKLAY